MCKDVYRGAEMETKHNCNTDDAALPIDRPCSACSAGDPEMKYHLHCPPFRVTDTPVTKLDSKPCIHCGGDWRECRCAFKKPKKDLWGGSVEFYTTSPKDINELPDMIQTHFPASLESHRECIFKVTVHYVEKP